MQVEGTGNQGGWISPQVPGLQCSRLTEMSGARSQVYAVSGRRVQNFGGFRCPDCGSSDGVRSRRRTVWEKYLLPAFMLQPVRCADCFRRFYSPLWVQVRERAESKVQAPKQPMQPSSHSRNRVA